MKDYLKKGSLILTVWMLFLIAGSLSGCDSVDREMNHFIGYFDLRATWMPEGGEFTQTIMVRNLTLSECRAKRIDEERLRGASGLKRLAKYKKTPSFGTRPGALPGESRGDYIVRLAAWRAENTETGVVRFECVRTRP